MSSSYGDGLSLIGTPIVVDANTASTRRALPTAPFLKLTVPANGCWFKFGTIDVVAAAGTAGVVATSTLTSTGVFTDTQTVTINGTVYTSQTTLTNVAGNFLIGANQTASHLNLLRAINAGAGAGSLYAAATVIHPTVTAISSDGTHTIINAKVAGTAGNAFTTTKTQTNASWTSTVMASGVDAVETSDYLPPDRPLVIRNPLYDQQTIGYIAAIKNGTAALLYVQGLG